MPSDPRPDRPLDAAGADRLRQVVTVVAFIVTVAINGAANALPINGQTTGSISDRFEVYVIPAGYVFAIWGVIYLGLAAFTVFQAIRGDHPIVRRVGWLPAISGVLNTVWLLLFQYELFVLTVPVMIALLVTLIVIHLRLWAGREELDRATTVGRPDPVLDLSRLDHGRDHREYRPDPVVPRLRRLRDHAGAGRRGRPVARARRSPPGSCGSSATPPTAS